MKKLLDTKKKMLKKMPNFTRSDAHKKKRLGKSWRKPKGLQSKRRLQKKGFKKIVKMGYRTPKKLRYKHESGMNNVFVETVKQLKSLNPETDVITIKNVGLKKKIIIMKEAETLKLKILNLDYKKLINKFEERKAKKREIEKANKKNKNIKIKKEENKEKIDLDKKKIEEKREKDKVLTKK